MAYIALFVLVAVVRWKSTMTQECNKGLYFSRLSSHCVVECPCGYYGDSVTQECFSANNSGDVFFNQTEYNLHSFPVNVSAGTKLGTAWLSLSLELVSFNESYLDPLSSVSLTVDFRGVIFDSSPIPWSRSLWQSYLDLEIAGQKVTTDGRGWIDNLQLRTDDVIACEEYLLLPINLLMGPGFAGVGINQFSMSVYFYHMESDTLFYPNSPVSIFVYSVCSSEQYYVTSTGQCVSECPCGTTQYPEFCDEATDEIIVISPGVMDLEFDPQTSKETLISTYTIYFNVSDGSPLVKFNDSGVIEMFVQLNGIRHFSGESHSSHFQFLYYYHYYKAQFGIRLPGLKDDTLIKETGPIKTIYLLSNPEIKTCLRADSKFLIVSMEIYLWSPFFYHLGLQWLTLTLAISEGEPKEYVAVLDNDLFISIAAECPDHLHYDFNTGDCVSECPCGFIGFDYHSPSYCEPAPAEPAWDEYHTYQEELSPARFAETAYLLALPWSSPPLTETVSVKVFVYLDSSSLHKFYPSLTNGSEIIAHIEVMYVNGSHAGQVPVNDAPLLELSGPTLPANVKLTSLNTSSTTCKLDFILKNSSQYGLEYCYDELQERVVGYIPITVTVTSPQQYSLLANHTFLLLMTFSVQNNSSLQLPADKSSFIVSIKAGNLGQTPSPPRTEPLIIGKDFYPFIDIKMFDHLQLKATMDGASDIIGIPLGLPFGNTIHTKAYVGVNGVISFGEKWHFWQAGRFPTSNPWSRSGYVVAPFWSDHDLRKSGVVYYAVIGSTQGEAVLKNVSDFIRHNHKGSAADEFEGIWMLVAHWDKVHPYPHGSTYSAAINYYDHFIKKRNSYQAIVITDGADSYALFTYNCDQMEWTGYWQHGVVGYNAKGDYYDNHPASGFGVVDTAIACANDLYGTPWNNVIYKLTPMPDLQLSSKKQCLMLIRKDQERLQSFDISDVEEQLEPCPCSLWQAQGDFGRFQEETFSGTCYVQRFPVKSSTPNETAFFTQECCYSAEGVHEFGSLISDGLHAGTMLSYHPLLTYSRYVKYDKILRDTCCTAGLCHEFLKLRHSQNCSGYVAPNWAWGYGDPHITTLDGRSYTFNGWGEYVLLEYIPQGSTSAKFVMQARTTAVNEFNVNSATQLSAVVFGIPGQLSFQVGLEDNNFHVIINANGTLEDITSILTNSDYIYNKTNGKAEIIRKAEDSIVAAFSDGAGVAISTSGGILSFILSLPSFFKGGIKGLLGNYNSDMTDEFIPRYKSTSLSNDISDREIHMFGQTWAVVEEETLFSYSLPEENFASFQFPDHQPVFMDEFSPSPEQVEVCGGHQQCEYDYAQTGSKEIGLATKRLQRMNAKNETLLANFPPRMVGDSVFRVTVGLMSLYTFSVTDCDGDFSVGVVGGLPMSSALISKGEGVFEFQLTLQRPTDLLLTFFSNDSLNALSTLSPRVEVCACANGGECTLEGLLSTDATTIIMNCLCTQEFDGEFCEEDRNGCLDIVCYEGVKCLDVAAPGMGAECSPCPPGLTGIVEDQHKCFDVNECAVNQTICEQQCVNEEGSYSCACWQGFRLDNGGMCHDIDECSESNGCQQICDNNNGSYMCNCFEGFELAADGKSCNVLAECATTSSCSQLCAIGDSAEICYCNMGYELDQESDSQCTDKDECKLYSPCNQACTNLPGSFKCSCTAGYELHEDGVTCTDVDECLEGAVYSLDLCAENTTCINLEGGYECACISGYSFVNGSCLWKKGLPALVLQTFPRYAADNAVLVIATGLVPSTFTSDKKQAFRRTTAELVTDYCLENICNIVSFARRRRLALIVEPKQVALQSIAQDSEDRLVFYLYVELEEGILTLKVLQNALWDKELRYIKSIDGLSSIVFVGVSLPPTTSVPSIIPGPSGHPVPDEGVALEIWPIALGIAAIIVVIVVFVAGIFWIWVKQTRQNKSYKLQLAHRTNHKLKSTPQIYKESII